MEGIEIEDNPYVEPPEQQLPQLGNHVNGNPGEPDDPPNNGGAILGGNQAPVPDFNLDNPELNTLCRMFRNCTKREAIALLLAVAVRDFSTYENVIHIMTALNTIFGRDIFPAYELSLWNLLGRSDEGLTKHSYCRTCNHYLGLWEQLEDNIECQCEANFPKSKAGVFGILKVKRQLQEFFTNPRLRNMLIEYRRNREKINENNLEDILDGEGYLQLRQAGGILEDDYNFSYTFNADALKVAKNSKTCATPIFLRLNELPFTVRQKHMFLVGLWLDEKKPNMNLFMDYFVDQANDLSRNGIVWQREDGEQITSKLVPTCCVADAMGRCEILNCVPPTAYFSCPYCTHAGSYHNGVKYPLYPPIPRPLPVRRTHADIINCMLEAPQRGLKGVAAVMNLHHFDLARGFSTDDLHPIFLGVTIFHLSLLLKSEGEPYYIGQPASLRRINQRMLKIRTPSFISRKPRKIQRYKSFKGTEARNFLLYYMVPCLRGVLPRRYLTHFALLSQAIFLISRETISERDLVEAQRCLQQYCVRFQHFFGEENMRFNVHILNHVIEMIRWWGPPYVQTTFHFESWNRHIAVKVTSPKGAVDQVVNRFFMISFVNSMLEHPNISERVKAKIKEILNGRIPHAVRVGNVSLLGRRAVRHPTAEEQLLLLQRGLDCPNVTVYRRARFDGVEFRCCHYTYDGGQTRSDDSYVYTWDDEFGLIEDIIMVEHNGARQVFLTISVLHTLEPINPSVSYAVRIDEEAENPMVLMTFTDIRGHAIRIDTPGLSSVMPVTNRYEID